MFLNQQIKAVRGEASWDPSVPDSKPNETQEAASIKCSKSNQSKNHILRTSSHNTVRQSNLQEQGT